MYLYHSGVLGCFLNVLKIICTAPGERPVWSFQWRESVNDLVLTPLSNIYLSTWYVLTKLLPITDYLVLVLCTCTSSSVNSSFLLAMLEILQPKHFRVWEHELLLVCRCKMLIFLLFFLHLYTNKLKIRQRSFVDFSHILSLWGWAWGQNSIPLSQLVESMAA